MWKRVFFFFFFKFAFFCGEVLAFTHYAFLLRTGRYAGYMIGIYPKASGFRLEFPLSPQGGFFVSFHPLLHISLPLSLFLSPFPCPRGSEFILQCATVAARETWTRVGGRYFGLSGSVVSDCAGPLSVFFGVVMQSGVGKLPETAAVHHTGKKGPITLTTCGLRKGDCGDGLVLVASAEMSI